MLFEPISKTIEQLDISTISQARKSLLNDLVDFIQEKINADEAIRLNFICTHNSRRSHLSQIWAQALAEYYGIKSVFSYSGGTEATAMFPKVAETLSELGFQIKKLAEGANPVYSIKFAANSHPVIAFSKIFDDDFNPQSGFAAIMTCSQADEGCPFIAGAEKRIPLTFEDPKLFDGTAQQAAKYMERSLQIATELKYVMQNVGGN